LVSVAGVINEPLWCNNQKIIDFGYGFQDDFGVKPSQKCDSFCLSFLARQGVDEPPLSLPSRARSPLYLPGCVKNGIKIETNNIRDST
jgi:hypothetical protein